MAESLGPRYQGLAPLVKASVPEEYSIIMAHQCGYAGRRYVHLTLHNGSNLISLVIARKEPGESLETLQPTEWASGVALYQAAARSYEVAGFETDRYLAYVVSDLDANPDAKPFCITEWTDPLSWNSTSGSDLSRHHARHHLVDATRAFLGRRVRGYISGARRCANRSAWSGWKRTPNVAKIESARNSLSAPRLSIPWIFRNKRESRSGSTVYGRPVALRRRNPSTRSRRGCGPKGWTSCG